MSTEREVIGAVLRSKGWERKGCYPAFEGWYLERLDRSLAVDFQLKRPDRLKEFDVRNSGKTIIRYGRKMYELVEVLLELTTVDKVDK